MSGDAGAQPLADAMMNGPRGRRLLLEYALASERMQAPESSEHPLSTAVLLAAYRLDPGSGRSRVMFGPGADAARRRNVTPEEVAEHLEQVPLAEATPPLLLLCLARSTDMARYWEDPDGEDLLAATVPLRDVLRTVAEHVAASSETAWWRSPMDASSQWSVQWDDMHPQPAAAEPITLLREARDRAIAEEQRAARERSADPKARWSGSWWSYPSWGIPSSTREVFDSSPAGLWCVEDGLGWSDARATRVGAAAGLRVFEIDTARAWAELCRRFPLEQTGEKLHDWYRVTGRAGRWVIPDWAAVAEHYDAVHLPVGTYLAAAGTAIPVGADTATVIAGWNPDQTYWFTPEVRHLGDPVEWTLEERGTEYLWIRRRPERG